MTIEEAYSLVQFLGEGSHPCGFMRGWVAIKGVNKGYDVMWTSHKDSHNRAFGSRCYSAVITPEGLSNHFLSAITMWPAEGKEINMVNHNLYNDIIAASKVKLKTL